MFLVEKKEEDNQVSHNLPRLFLPFLLGQKMAFTIPNYC